MTIAVHAQGRKNASNKIGRKEISLNPFWFGSAM
jgi:hypothetical protein